MSDDWKRLHANESEKAIDHPMVQGVIVEQLGNLNREGDPLATYGLNKIASYAAQVARAQAFGFDPELLRLTPNEANSELMRLASEAVYRGVPVIVYDDND